VRVTGLVVVVVTVLRTVVRDVLPVVGAVVGAGVAVATGAAAVTAAGCSGAFVTCRFPPAKAVIPPKLLSVIAVASARSARVDETSGFRWRFM
jgi:O-antigen/teichoic acid export membrane protein